MFESIKRTVSRHWSNCLLVVGGIAVLGVVFYKPAAEPKVRKVRVLYLRIVAAIPHLIAEKKGIYKKYNLSVDANSTMKSPDMVEAVRTGQVDFLPAISLVDAINSSVGEEAPTIVIVSHSRMKKNVPFDGLLVTPGSPLGSLKDLAGHKVGVFPGGTSEASVRWYLEAQGIGCDKISFVPVPPREQIEALLAGKVDAIHAYEPEQTLGRRQYQCRLLSPSIYASMTEPCPIGCTGISAKFMREQPDVALDVLKAWDEAISFYRANEKEARELLVQEFGYPRDVAENCTWVDATRTNELDAVCLQDFIKQLQRIQPPQIRPGDIPRGTIYGR